MRKIILSAIAMSCLLTSCADTPNNNSDKSFKKKFNAGDELFVMEIDSCEYVVYDGYRAGNVIHKENCKYCLKRNRETAHLVSTKTLKHNP